MGPDTHSRVGIAYTVFLLDLAMVSFVSASVAKRRKNALAGSLLPVLYSIAALVFRSLHQPSARRLIRLYHSNRALELMEIKKSIEGEIVYKNPGCGYIPPFGIKSV
jgi:hypothetical protein